MLTISVVNIEQPNNAWWTDHFQFGDADDVSWSFTGKHFLCDIKVASDDAAALLALSSAGGTIVVDDVVQRILHFNVTDLAIRAALPVGPYVYDLIMVTDSTGQRDPLMRGKLIISQGVTVED